ncbi:hypothetical protein RND81_13G006900 [Saponaria officinalis]|uniref:F-box domain-containing protein n=1 Tax=Saponaria officinalis TaxID=3572 RepID=A0AAW1GSE9_SAPOF
MSTPPQPPPPSPPSSISDLLIDFILAEILPKLPAKSLLRFKCVCQSFNTLISSPEFIRRHLRHSLSSDNRLLVIPATNLTHHTFDLDSLSAAAAVSATFSFPDDDDVSVGGSCNGLLLITGGFSLVLLNPSTRTYVDVPSTGGNLGFGFDHRSDDYKIVAVSDDHINANRVKTRITKIYSVNSKSWKVVDRTLPSDSIEQRHGGVLINNHLLHWMFWSPSMRKRRIGCFDICLEKWTDDVLLPSYYYDPSHKNYFLDFGVVDGKMYSSFENRVDSSFDVWVMKEYGVQESWMKLLSVAISDDLKGGVVPVACREAGSSQVLLRQRHESKLFWYNRMNGVISKVNVPYFSDHHPYICKGSLVSLPGAKLFGAVYEPDESDESDESDREQLA